MIEIIPAIDLIDGKCVRLKQGDFQQKTVYNENPVEVAKSFEDAGIKRLHLVDLDGAKKGKVTNLKVLEDITSNTALSVDFGGGIKTEEDIIQVFNAGADLVTVGSIAVKEPELFAEWLDSFGGERIILGADVKENNIAVNGWKDVVPVTIFDFLKEKFQQGAEYVLCTDISKDGMLQGTSMGLYKELQNTFSQIKLIASGGISSVSEIEELNEMDVFGVIIGKAIYEGKITLKELEKYSI